MSLQSLAGSTDRELVVARLLDAPVGVVFEAFTKPEHLVRWWGPRGFTTTISEMDVRPGGEWRMVMHGPDGRDYHNRIVFIEIERPRRLVYKHEPEPGSEPVQFEVTVTFDDDGAQKTLLTMRMVFPTAANRDWVVKTYGADEGGRQTLERFDEYLAQRKQRLAQGLTLKRTLKAPRELVFRAWTDPRHMAQWWCPEGFSTPVCESDARAGGRIVIHMYGPDGRERPIHGQFLEVEPPGRLVFQAIHQGPDGGVIFESRNTVTLVEGEGGRTELTLEVQVVHLAEGAQGVVFGMEKGWTQAVDRLEALY